jgi:glycosyltransferase involved in cell wall biosynthesis
MRIFNIMVSRGLGGIEQAFLDYGKALTLENHQVFNITAFGAEINKFAQNTIKLPNLLPWCLLSKIYLRILISIHRPDVIIAHGNRAISFAKAFKPNNVPLIGVAHNYSYKYLKFCDYVIVITDHLRKYMSLNGYEESRIGYIPNMIEVKARYITREFKDPVVIGTFGRFVAKKGFDDYIKAIALLKGKGIKVKALLGGGGAEEEALKKLAKANNLEDTLSFTGWVTDKEEFFRQIDIFCLPSRDEPFGIVLLEAMQHSLPIVSTKSQGPCEILRDKVDALLTDIGSPEGLAGCYVELMDNHTKAAKLSSSAYLRLTENYDIQVVSKRLSELLNKIVTAHEL